MDLNLSELRKTFLTELNIKFIRFACSEQSDTQELVSTKYPVYNEKKWIKSVEKFNSKEKKLVLKGRKWMGCLCRPKNANHSWISYYECEDGWNLERIMAASRHNYLWGSIACYFAKNKWLGGNLHTAKVGDLWINYPMEFKNQVAEAAYILNFYIAIVNETVYVSHDSYS